MRELPPRQELGALTGLRYGAAIWVVLFHFAPVQSPGVPRFLRDFIELGYLAVALFFVLSGFVLAYSYLDAAGRMRTGTPSFWVARFARIYPAYLTSFLLSIPLYVVAKAATGTFAAVTIRSLGTSALYLFLIQAWTPWTAFIMNYPAWSLSAEAFFYFCFPWARRLFKIQSRSLVLAICACFLLAVIPRAVVFWADPPRHGDPDAWQNFSEVFPLFRVAQFLLGVLLAKLYRDRPSDGRAAKILVGSSIVVGLATFTNASKLPIALVETVALAVFAALIYGLAYGEGWVARVLSLRVPVLLGHASYAVYIYQRPLAAYLGVTRSDSWPKVAGYIIVLTAASIGSMFWIEHPSRRFVQRWWKTRRIPQEGVQYKGAVSLGST